MIKRAGISLIEPCEDLRDSYNSLIREFLANREHLIPFTLRYSYEDFPALVAKLEDHSRGIGVPGGFVANSTFRLVDGSEEIVAVSNLRHSLTPKLKREGGHVGYGVGPSQRRKGYGYAVLRETLKRAREMD